jgi:hypothetical protein
MSAPRHTDETATAIAVLAAGALAWFCVMVADLAATVLLRDHQEQHIIE